MAKIDATQNARAGIELPERTYLPIKTVASSLQDVLRALNKISRLGKNLSYSILQGQPALASLSFGNIAGKASCVDKLLTLPVNAEANMHMLYRSILAKQTRFIILQHFAGSQTHKDILDDIPIGMKLRDIMPFIFLASV